MILAPNYTRNLHVADVGQGKCISPTSFMGGLACNILN